MSTTLTDWHRRMAAMVAAGNPMTPATPIRASGNHRAAQNDEPEPDEAAICIACNGSGEGQYDGTRCRSCGLLCEQVANHGLLLDAMRATPDRLAGAVLDCFVCHGVALASGPGAGVPTMSQ